MQIICGHCGQQYEFDERPPDDVITCSNCGHSIYLKTPADQSEFDESLYSDEEGENIGFAEVAHQKLSLRMIIFCSKCGEQMKIRRKLAGRTIRCRFCSQMLRVPFLDDDDQTGADKPGEMPDPYQAVDDLRKAVKHSWKKSKRAEKKPLTSRRAFWILLGASAAVGVVTIVVYRPQIRNYVKSIFDKSPVTPPADIASLTAPSAIPTARFINASWTAFAHDGYVPARPGHWYCNLTVEIQAGKKPLFFANVGSTVTLRDSKNSFESLGEYILSRHKFSPTQARRRVVKLKPRARQTITLLFELPASLRDVSLHIGSLAPQVITLPPPPRPLQPMAVEYVEFGPRNCRPLLRDPIMAAIQAVLPQALDISHRDGVLRVTIPALNITGRGRFLDEDLYELTFIYGSDRLVCKLRQIDDNLVILYLSDEPMHQITYRRTVLIEPSQDEGRKNGNEFDEENEADYFGI